MIQIHPTDNVAVALHPVTKGTVFAGITAAEDIPQGHKMALRSLAEGEQVKLVSAGRYDVSADTGEKEVGLCPKKQEVISGEEMLRQHLKNTLFML